MLNPPLILSLYDLKIWQSPAVIGVQFFRGRESLSQPYRYLIYVTSPEADILPEQVLLKTATFTLQPPVPDILAGLSSAHPDGGVKVVHGVIRHLKRLSTSADETRYRLELVPRLQLLAHRERCAIYQNQSVPEIVEQVLRAHDFEGADFEFRLSQTYPTRELITQWRESDLAFVQRLLAEVGIYYRFEMDSRLAREVVIFSDSAEQYQFGVHLPLHNTAGMNDSGADSVWGLKTTHQVVTKNLTTQDYNYRYALTPLLSQANAAPNDLLTYGEVYRYAEPYRNAGAETDPEPESGGFFARLNHERLLNHQHTVMGWSTSPSLAVGQVLEPAGDLPAALAEGILLTTLTCSGARDKSYRVRLQGQPYRETVCFRPPLWPRPVMVGTFPARIESTEKNDTYAWLDPHGRYRVKVQFDLDGWKAGEAYLWVRLAKPYAGETYGWHTPLLDGTEVALAFDGGDCDRPYIAHAFHDSEHPDLVTGTNHTRNVLRTPANNKLRLEDQRGETHAKLATEYGKSQLNLGHLVDAQRQQRGSGFELRTDEHGAVRAGKGLFISAEEQPKAQGQVLDMTKALDEIAFLKKQVEQLSDAAEQANTLAADLHEQVAMFEARLKPLNEAILASAPSGIALTSDSHVQLAAGDNLMVNVGGHADIGVMDNMTLQVGGSLGVFAQQSGIQLKANGGKVEVQAQNNTLSLLAKGKISLMAVDGDVLFAAKKRLKINAGGSYLILQDGKIEYGTRHDYVRKTVHTVKTKSTQQPITMPHMPLVEGYSQYFVIQDQKTGKELKHFPYTLYVNDQKIEGVTNEKGHTQRAYTTESESIELVTHSELFNREHFQASYWDIDAPLKLDFSKTEKKEK
ncbi:type VI secretion system tip protein VgrG [Xenorhabdus sp. ZM]|uniref:type VI secretion system Vgr family protein n=1 Tax=Xenorhabdus szentirmaii TaxID=290112 RepID=UPI00199AEEC6|nr:type VI secretion system tip protein VgrG [Xenorhabdus sp. ZM]MBD2805022.1 type VI secretion system tip protein VgrG [Xenorhabdus sp. ZM]